MKAVVKKQAFRAEARPVCWVTGPAVQVRELAAVMRERARAGEIEVLGPMRAHPRNPGLVVQPYVLRTPRPAWRRPPARIVLGGAVGVYVLTAAALAWESRWVLLMGGGAVLSLLAGMWLVRLFATGHACRGLHCSGCRG